MKIVYNSNGYGLQLTADEMEKVANKCGFTLRKHQQGKGSNETWFLEVDWGSFRTDPRLIGFVEDGKLSNKNLRITEIPDGATWEIDTDWHTYETIRYYEEHWAF